MAHPAYRSRQLTVAVVGLLLAAVALTGCSRHSPRRPTPAASASVAASGNGGLGAGPGTASASATPAPGGTTAAPPGSYPADARSYGLAAITAWVNGQTSRLGDLTAPGVATNFVNIGGHPDTHWAYYNCQGAAGTQYCVYRNNNGDELQLRLRNDLLGKAHAVVEAIFEQTAYASSPDAYVSAFLLAWTKGNRQRMLALSNQGTVDFVTHYTPPASWTLTTDGAAGSTYVRATNPAGFDLTVRVINQNLGQPHAISCAVLGSNAC